MNWTFKVVHCLEVVLLFLWRSPTPPGLCRAKLPRDNLYKKGRLSVCLSVTLVADLATIGANTNNPPGNRLTVQSGIAKTINTEIQFSDCISAFLLSSTLSKCTPYLPGIGRLELNIKCSRQAALEGKESPNVINSDLRRHANSLLISSAGCQ
jgi:hypothetical protein